jgi:hypothetical protein
MNINRTVPNGGGLELTEGFSATDGTGYLTRRTRGGCQPLWPGFFIDYFNYSAKAQGHDLSFGRYWGVTPDFTNSYVLQADNQGHLLNSGSNPPNGLYPSCTSVPLNIGDQFAECYSSPNGTTNHPTNGTPLFAGGPKVMTAADGTGGFGANAYNEFYDAGGGDYRHSFWFLITNTDNPGATTYKSFLNCSGSGFNSSGWNNSAVWLMLLGTKVDATHTRLRLYINNPRTGGTPLIDYTTANGRTDGVFGIDAEPGCKLSYFVAGERRFSGA